MNRLCIVRIGFILLVSVLSFCPAVYADFRSPHNVIIQSETRSPTSVYAADLDGDGDLDVLSASNRPDIAWYENDGSGHFGTQRVITNQAGGARSVYAADLDGDGDLDVLSASSGSTLYDKIAWYENDGTGHFGPLQVITTLAAGAKSVYAADLDGDGDLDVLSASFWDNKVAWYENNGYGQFSSEHVISNLGANSVYAADLDGDGDLDVLTSDLDTIALYENDGFGQFGSREVITGMVLGTECVYAADLDDDGDLDVLWASSGDDKIGWYENE